MTVQLINPKKPVTAYLAKGYFNLIKIGNKTKQIDMLKKAGVEEKDKNIIKIKKEIDDLTNELAMIKNHIKNFSDDLRYTTILEQRFLNGLSLLEISFNLNFSYDWTERLYSRALKEFEKYLKENSMPIQQGD